MTVSQSALGAWQPIFVGPAADKCLEAVRDVLAAVDRHPVGIVDWGRPLLHTYFAATTAQKSHSARAIELIDRASAAIEEHLHLPCLYGGFAGVGWLAAHTDTLLGRAADDTYDELDQALVAVAERSGRAVYDLIGGVVGIGVYFLERLPNPVGEFGLTAVLASLARTAEQREGGTTWWTPPELLWEAEREFSPHGFHNLGVAHGVPGIIGLLAEMANAGIERPRATELARRAIRWVLNQRVSGGLPAWVAPNLTPVAARVAWCYGSLGFSVVLLSAAQAFNDRVLKNQAIELALEASRRRVDAGVFDAGLCHGAAGIAHLFNRLYQATARSEFQEAATYWFARTLGMRQAGIGVAGYQPYRPHGLQPNPPEHPTASTSFLTGATGIALALLAATSSVPPNWDRVLLSRVEPTMLPRTATSLLPVPDEGHRRSFPE